MKSWFKLLNAFNNLKTGENRTITELKIKYKNLKQKDSSLFLKSYEESDDDSLVVDKDLIPKVNLFIENFN